MITGIDHIIIAVADLNVAVRSYRGLGFTVVPGGRHPIGTHNALISFADGSYLELIAFFEPHAQHRWYQRLQQGGGLKGAHMRFGLFGSAQAKRGGPDVDSAAG